MSTFLGTTGNDTVTATAGTINDSLFGDLGDDTLAGLGGADTLNGGGGTDTVTYAASGAGVTVTLGAVGVGGDALGDLLRRGGQIAIGDHIQQVQKVFKGVFNAPDISGDGREFDVLFKGGDQFKIGELTVDVLHTPGHTPACVTYLIGDDAFVGDTLFMPDVGTARCDFPGGDAKTLYASTRKILSLPPETRLFMCHDYPPNGRPVNFETTVAEQKAKNIHVHDGISEDQFVEMRTKRDATLEMPVLILPAVQINIRAGELPPKEDNGIAYAKIPLNAL